MNLRRIKHTLLRLSTEEKVIGLGSLAILIGTFMPWYTVVMSFDKETQIESGFSGDLGVIGFVIFLMGLISLITLVAENLHLPLPRFNYKKEQILFFMLGQSAFMTLLTMAVYTKRSLDFTDAGLRFGVYLVLIGALFAALSAFSLIQKTRKKEVVEFFEHEEKEPETVDEMMDQSYKTARAVEIMGEDVVSFREDEGLMKEMEPIEREKNISDYEENISDYIEEDDTTEDIQEVKKVDDQGNHFMREAGLGHKSKDKSLGMNFYDDN